MTALVTLSNTLGGINAFVLRIGRAIGIVAIALMVLAILIQVFFRYVLNNALPWPDEAARFFMLWMTGLIAPLAYRRGGFVAIDMLEQALGRRMVAVLSLFLLVVSLLVLVVGVQLGWNHVQSGTLFSSASLKINLIPYGWGVWKLKLAWMYASLFVGLCLMLSVNIELILRNLTTLMGGGDDLIAIHEEEAVGAS